MKVSIIIPVYNGQRYLEECIESALNQTYNNVEVIAVNDGSTDNSLQILKRYSDRIKIIDKKNGGTASALNVGIKTMTGEWYKRLSQDDILYENAVEVQIKTAKKLNDYAKNCIFCTDHEIIDSNGKKIDEYLEPAYNHLNDFERNVHLLDRMVGNSTTSFHHKSLFDRFGLFNENLAFQEDYEFWLRVCFLYGCRIYLIPKITAKYRYHKNQLAERTKYLAKENTKMIQKMILDKIDPELRDRYIKRLEFVRNHNIIMKLHLRRNFVPKEKYSIAEYYLRKLFYPLLGAMPDIIFILILYTYRKIRK